MKDLLNLRKDRDIGTALSDVFSFIKQNRKPLGKILLYLIAPFVLLGSLVTVWGQYLENYANIIDAEDSIFQRSASWVNNFAILLQIFASAVMTSCILIFICLYEKNFHKEANGIEKAKEITTKDISRNLWGKVFIVFGYTIIWYIILFTSAMLLFLPGIFISVSTSLLFVVYFIEQKDFSGSMSRSMELVRKNWWRTFIFWILLLLISLVFVVFLYLPSMIIGGVSSFFQVTEFTTTDVIVEAIVTFLSSISNGVFTVGSAIWYYSLVEKKEAISLENKIGRIGEEDNEDMFR